MKRLTGKNEVRMLTFITWITYFSTYLGRLNFSASINEISMNLGIEKGTLGTIASAFFIAYGAGQIISGILGDRLPSLFMVFTGVAGAAVMNLIFGFLKEPLDMKIVWFLNGFFQSMTWPPMAKWISDRVDQKTCTKICLFLSTTGPVGMLCSYLISALSIKYFDWKAGFYSTAGIMLAMAVLWLGITLLLEKRGEEIQEEKVQKKADSKDGMLPLILQSGLIMVAAAAFIHGLLKDGISTWVPTYLAENYSLSSVLAIIMTMALPVINLSGVYLANWWNQWYFHTEMKTAAAFFGTTAAAVAGMSVLGKESAGISVLFFAVITTSMTAINTLLVSLVPLHFKKVNKVSTVIGVLNSVTYLGTAAGSSLFGILAERYGWGFLRAIWFIVAIVGIAVSWMGRKKWNEFRGNW